MLQPKRIDAIVYDDIRDDFVKWLMQTHQTRYAKKLISDLDRFASGKRIRTPMEMLEVRESANSKKNMTIALRNILNYLEIVEMLDPHTLASMRKVLNTIPSNPDNYLPPTEKVRDAYFRIERETYRIAYKILAFSGIRVVEAFDFINNYDPDKLVVEGRVARYPLFSLRKSKRAYYVYMPREFGESLERMKIKRRGFDNHCYHKGFAPKYLRKWNYNFLIMHNVPESVADFLQGRSPVSVGSMHYLAKVKQADFWYGKVADALVEVFEE